jgi:hypothetical protein
MSEKRAPAEMFGECMREAAVLLGVFLPRDFYLERSLTWERIGLTVVVAVGLLGFGILVEVLRR